MELTDRLLEQVRQKDAAALETLDRHGFLPAEEETHAEFADRLGRFREKMAEFEAKMQPDLPGAVFEIPEDRLVFTPADRIPAAVFAEAAALTEPLYGFSVAWVPGFYKDCGALFGGGAYAFPPELFSVFIINEAFAEQERWLIYHRQELLGHELCHVARSGFASPAYEEFLAYQTAGTWLRRNWGGVVHRERDTYLFLASALLPLLGQVASLSFGIAGFPAWPLWLPFFAVGFWLGGRHLRLLWRFRQAEKRLHPFCHEGRTLPVLFRCSDAEIQAIASFGSAASLLAWLETRPETPRWQVIRSRFLRAGTP